MATKATTYQGGPCKRGHVGIRRVRGGDCVECNKDRARERWNREPGYKDKWLAQRRVAYATEGGREYRRERNLVANYGLSSVEFDRMLEAQNYLCAICDADARNASHRFNVDHDHDSGQIRALLCANCNRGLGAFQDSPQVAEKAAAYLRNHGRP